MKAVQQNVAGGKAGNAPRLISIVDDDASIREALKGLMRSARLNAQAFASAEDFLASESLHATSCLILDVHLPGMNGFELQNRLQAEGHGIPIIFITAHADETSRERALKGGAIEFLSKPVRREPLFNAIRTAMNNEPGE